MSTPNGNYRKALITGMLAGGLVLSSSVTAYYKIQPTLVEWDSWPDYCKSAKYLFINTPQGRSKPKLTKKQTDLSGKHGIWHFCHSYIMVQRLELNTHPSQREKYLRQADEGIQYVLRQKPDLKEPMIADVVITHARLLRQQKEPEKALKLLDKLRSLHPTYLPIYSAYTALYFDKKTYAPLIALLEEGNKATENKVAEIQYYLGLAYLKAGDIENARIYEKKAREGGYPFRYLTRKLAEYDAKHQATGE